MTAPFGCPTGEQGDNWRESLHKVVDNSQSLSKFV